MKSLEPKYTKLRLYVRQVDTPILASFHRDMSENLNRALIDAFEILGGNENSIVEIVALRQSVHQRIVPMIEEAFPGAFYTMEAVCGFRVASGTGHQLYR